MKKNKFPTALQKTQATTSVLVDAVNHLIDILDNCPPEKAGEILNDAVAIVGIAHLLLIDINNLANAGQSSD